MELRQAFHQRKAKPGSARSAVVTIIGLREGLEDRVQLHGWNADAGILHDNQDTAFLELRAGERDVSVLRRKFVRIGKQVNQDLLEGTLIGPQMGQTGLDTHRQRLMLEFEFGRDKT